VRKAAPYLPEYLPEELIRKYNLPSLRETVEQLHLPRGLDVRELNSFSDPYHRRMIYEDLLLFQLALAVKKRAMKGEQSPRIKVPPDFISRFEEKLSFPLTRAQRRVIGEILSDMERGTPMNRLLQGDVGSGKTVVALTEILAEQHYRRFREFLEKQGVQVGLLTGSLSSAQKRSVYRHIREGNLKVVIGTHALIQEKVEFRQLGLVIIDEQHRFGVMQRKLLLEKGKGRKGEASESYWGGGIAGQQSLHSVSPHRGIRVP